MISSTSNTNGIKIMIDRFPITSVVMIVWISTNALMRKIIVMLSGTPLAEIAHVWRSQGNVGSHRRGEMIQY